MKDARILVIGGGIGGLTSAIALRATGFEVEVIERDPKWSVYGVGIIQQSNVIRAVAQLGILQDYVAAGFGFDFVDVYLPNGEHAARVPSPRLVEGYPANLGISRRALHEVLGRRAIDAGAAVHLACTADSIDNREDGAAVVFSDGRKGEYDLVIGADGLHSQTRQMIFPEAPTPEFTGQGVWRCNFKRPENVVCLRAYEGSMGTGLVPLSSDLMYLFVTTPEPDNPWYEDSVLATEMRRKLKDAPPGIAELADRITEESEIVYKPLETVFVDGPWYRNRVVLLGDAVHATTPHLGQGAGMAIEDSLVLAEELGKADTVAEALNAFQTRRFERCKFVVDLSLSLCRSQLGKGPKIEQAAATRDMFQAVVQPL